MKLAIALTLFAQAQAPASGTQVLERMLAAYEGKWYKTLTFVQTTIFHRADGSAQAQIWLESVDRNKLRIDFDSVGSGNGLVFTPDSTIVVQRGQVARRSGTGNPFLPLIMGVYLQPVAQTARELAAHHFDLQKVHTRTWRGRNVWVVGAAAESDTTSPQFWVEPERLVVVRMLIKQTPTSPVLDVDLGGYVRAGQGWLATHIFMKANGAPVQDEVYSDWKVDVRLDPALFDVSKWATATHWKR
jgi:hypothetical protein